MSTKSKMPERYWVCKRMTLCYGRAIVVRLASVILFVKPIADSNLERIKQYHLIGQSSVIIGLSKSLIEQLLNLKHDKKVDRMCSFAQPSKYNERRIYTCFIQF